jgi:hypothetical protein
MKELAIINKLHEQLRKKIEMQNKKYQANKHHDLA